MSARERLLAALEASPEVRPGTAPQMIADVLNEAADVAQRFNSDCQSCATELEVASALRRMAAAGQAPAPQQRVAYYDDLDQPHCVHNERIADPCAACGRGE
jgi:hypothetical protein